MFKKIGYDFTIIQSERSDGDKLVLSMETIDKGIPVPSGVNRLKVSTMVTGIPLNGNHRQGHPCTIRGQQAKGQYHGNRYTSQWKP